MSNDWPGLEVKESDADYLVRRVDGGPLEALTQFPRYFEIETINACNAKCPMCTIADWQRQPQVMKDDLFERIASEIGEHSSDVKRVHLYRDGEPLLDKKLPQRIKRMKDAGVKEVGISTNVELLDEDRALAILQAGLDEAILSIDSMVPSVYSKIRVGLDWFTVVENAERFFALRDGLRSKCKIRLRMIKQASNEAEWYHGRFQADWNWRVKLRAGDRIECRDIHNWGGQLKDWKPVKPPEWAVDYPQYVPADTSRPCLALWSLMTIFADGSVPLCNVDYNNKHPVGNVRDNTIAELWQSKTQNHRRWLHMKGLRGAIPPCTNCTVWSEKARTEKKAAA